MLKVKDISITKLYVISPRVSCKRFSLYDQGSAIYDYTMMAQINCDPRLQTVELTVDH